MVIVSWGEVGNEVYKPGGSWQRGTQSVSISKINQTSETSRRTMVGEGAEREESIGYLELDKSIFKDSENQM